MDPITALFLNYHRPQPNERLLILEGGDGSMARQIAAYVPTGEVLTLARDVREAQAAQKLLAPLPNASASDDVFPSELGQWDSVLVTVPKGRRYARTLLLAAWSALRPEGQLFVVGPTQGGVNALIADAERLFGNGLVLGYKKHQRIARSMRPAALPDPLPAEFAEAGIAPGTQHIFSVECPQGVLQLESHPGLFSWDALDEGTRLLLETVHFNPNERVWDVGCGNGVIGLAAALAGAKEVAMSDVNLLAVRYAQRNALQNQLAEKVNVFAADGISPQRGQWDLLIANPTFHEGAAVDRAMAERLIAEAPACLSPRGRLVIVANRFLNYDKLLSRHFTQVVRLADTPQFHVIEGSR